MPEVTSDWARRVRSRGVRLPIRVGMPGYVNRQKLLRISASIGLGESARFLRRQRNWLLKLFLPGGYSPDRLIEGLKPGFADPESNIQGLHIYTFNECADDRGVAARDAGARRNVRLTEKGSLVTRKPHCRSIWIFH